MSSDRSYAFGANPAKASLRVVRLSRLPDEIVPDAVLELITTFAAGEIIENNVRRGTSASTPGAVEDTDSVPVTP